MYLKSSPVPVRVGASHVSLDLSHSTRVSVDIDLIFENNTSREYEFSSSDFGRQDGAIFLIAALLEKVESYVKQSVVEPKT